MGRGRCGSRRCGFWASPTRCALAGACRFSIPTQSALRPPPRREGRAVPRHRRAPSDPAPGQPRRAAGWALARALGWHWPLSFGRSSKEMASASGRVWFSWPPPADLVKIKVCSRFQSPPWAVASASGRAALSVRVHIASLRRHAPSFFKPCFNIRPLVYQVAAPLNAKVAPTIPICAAPNILGRNWYQVVILNLLWANVILCCLRCWKGFSRIFCGNSWIHIHAS